MIMRNKLRGETDHDVHDHDDQRMATDEENEDHVYRTSDNDWGVARSAKCGIITLTTSHLPHHHHLSQSIYPPD